MGFKIIIIIQDIISVKIAKGRNALTDGSDGEAVISIMDCQSIS